MFAGIVEDTARVAAVTPHEGGMRLRLRPGRPDLRLRPGSSLSVNGVCLTAVGVSEGEVEVDVVPETLARTALGGLRPGDRVNLERGLRLGDRIDGHLVQGHVDGVGRVLEAREEGSGRRLRIGLPPGLSRYLTEKGSVAVDGVSLTVAVLGEEWFEVALIPHTLAATALGGREPGDPVNLEVDLLAKYVERMLGRVRP